MATIDHPVRAVTKAAEKVPEVAAEHDEARDTAVNALGAIGWCTRGIVYLVAAGIVVKVGWSSGAEQQQPTKSGVLNTLSDRSGGLVLVALLGIGAVAYVLVRLAPLVLYRGSSSWQQRGQALAAAVLYLPLALGSLHLIRGESVQGGVGGNEGETNGLGAELLQHTWGTFLLVAAGLGLIGYGGYQIYKGVGGRFLRKLDVEASVIPRNLIRALGTVGFVARGAIAIVLGLFLGWAALARDSSSVHSLDGAIRQFTDAPIGTPVLTLVGLGLAAFAGYCFCAAATRDHDEG